jgi:hypothetical protein
VRTAVFFVGHLRRCARTGPPLQMPSPNPASVRTRYWLQRSSDGSGNHTESAARPASRAFSPADADAVQGLTCKVPSFPPLHNQPRRVAPYASLLAHMRQGCPVTSGAPIVPQAQGGSRPHYSGLGASRQPVSSALHGWLSLPAEQGDYNTTITYREWHGEAR